MRSGVTLLLDRDGTLVHDVPYNRDPAAVQVLAGVTQGLQRVRARGIQIALVSNQSAVGRGFATEGEVAAVNAALADAVGGFDLVLVCPHDEIDGCDCRKPAPGLLISAMDQLRSDPERTVMVGDIGSDIQAASAIGVRSILIPNSRTRTEEIASAPVVRRHFRDAIAAVCAFHDTGRWL